MNIENYNNCCKDCRLKSEHCIKNCMCSCPYYIIGPKGSPGVRGPQGAQGPQGIQGIRGERGETGPQGPQGEQGPVGPQGVAGEVGATGPQGPVGPRGERGETGPVGLQGPAGEVGATGPQGIIGPTGPQGPAGEVGATGPQGIIGPTGPQGPQGEVGPVGPQGMAGEVGATGPQGPAGTILGYADFYALMPPDNSVTVAIGGDVSFPQDGPNSNTGISRLSDSSFNLADTGVYQVMFQVSVAEAGQLILTLNENDLPYTVVGRATGTSQIVGMAIVDTSIENSVLTVQNPTGSPSALTITPLAGGVRPVSAHLTIIQLA